MKANMENRKVELEEKKAKDKLRAIELRQKVCEKLYISSKYKHVHLLTLHICTTTYYSYINSICIFTIHVAWSDVNLSTVPFKKEGLLYVRGSK